MVRREQYGLTSCLWDGWGPPKTNPAAVNSLYCKGKEAQKWQNPGNHIRASLAFTANEDHEGKNHQETDFYQTVLTTPQPTNCCLSGATALLWSWSGTSELARTTKEKNSLVGRADNTNSSP